MNQSQWSLYWGLIFTYELSELVYFWSRCSCLFCIARGSKYFGFFQWQHVHQYLKCLCFSTTCLAPPFGFTASSSNRLAAPLATPVEDTTSLPLQGIHHHSASATQVSSFLQWDESEFYPKPLRIILTESCKMSQVSDIPFFPWSPTLAKVLVPQLFWGPLCHWNPLRRGWSGWRWNCNEMTAWYLNGGIQ